MRQLTAAVAIVAAGILVAGCGDSSGDDTAASSSTTTTASPKTPLAKAALADLMLSPDEIDSTLGVKGTASDPPFTALMEEQVRRTDYTLPAECKYAIHTASVPQYAASGSTAVYGYHDLAPAPAGADRIQSPGVDQFVVLFPTPDEASAFFTASSQRWPACANRQDTVPANETDPEMQWKVGPISNADGVLSAPVTLSVNRNGTNASTSCQRALTVRRNVVIDVDVCRKDVGDLGVNIANQIAGKVDKQ
ncbi:sensor domain-containing protein [Mycobacterium sp.]|uniref:sensor domain-containing protein n=1 Tax=Mycobacterium sp. TaxID=1785 RepID=UPI00121BC2D4|nr:sensor domain-containing protein [Mycobacterium sp.]TAM72147.1 MAG: sensor domain-containing protein [Mycobacterium sp.]